jgi:hypothetical protein
LPPRLPAAQVEASRPERLVAAFRPEGRGGKAASVARCRVGGLLPTILLNVKDAAGSTVQLPLADASMGAACLRIAFRRLGPGEEAGGGELLEGGHMGAHMLRRCGALEGMGAAAGGGGSRGRGRGRGGGGSGRGRGRGRGNGGAVGEDISFQLTDDKKTLSISGLW